MISLTSKRSFLLPSGPEGSFENEKPGRRCAKEDQPIQRTRLLTLTPSQRRNHRRRKSKRQKRDAGLDRGDPRRSSLPGVRWLLQEEKKRKDGTILSPRKEDKTERLPPQIECNLSASAWHRSVKTA
ncbi:hypothetical protein AAC387_Pa06g1745 [Persea americana]